jgi:hypothetical protein
MQRKKREKTTTMTIAHLIPHPCSFDAALLLSSLFFFFFFWSIGTRIHTHPHSIFTGIKEKVCEQPSRKMGWLWWLSLSPRQPQTGTANDTPLQDTQSVIASIFEPGNRVLTAAPASSSDPNARRCAEPSTGLTSSTSARVALQSGTTNSYLPMEATCESDGGWRAAAKRLGAWWPRAGSPSSSSTAAIPSGGVDEGVCGSSSPPSATTAAAASSSGSTSVPAISWDQLPPSPLAGYELTKRGLVDTLRTPPHTLSSAELKDLLSELIMVEQKAKYDVDKQFAGHLGSRGLHGLELLVNPCLFLTGLYLMTWKTVQLYSCAVPQDSLVFTKLLALLQKRMPANQREQLAQRHRRLMRVTNARVALTFLTGVAVFSLAWVSRPMKNVMEEAPDMRVTKDMVAYQRHAEASLKWCWYVYYHHPTYCSAGSGGRGEQRG